MSQIDNKWIDKAVEEATQLFDFVRFAITDIHGISRSKMISKKLFKQSFHSGVTIFCGTVCFGPRSEIPICQEMKDVNYANGIMRPLPGTMHLLPWATDGKYKVGEVLCEMFWNPPYRDGAPQEACPRHLARVQLENLKKLGYRFMSGYEAEFFVFHGDKPLSTGCDMYSSLLLAENEDLILWIIDQLSQSGVDVEAFNCEYGDGQIEFPTTPKTDIESADQMFVLKQSVKELCQKKGYSATFMCEPSLSNTIDSGQHFTHSLWTDGLEKNVFHDPSSEDGFSDIGRHWVAGLLTHGRALTALCSPTVNCYRRIRRGSFCPVHCNWGFENRTAMIRVKSGEKSAMIENRLPSSAANPYIILAGTIIAGMDGIVNKLACPSVNDTINATKLPMSLIEALDCLEADTVMCDGLGREFIRWFVGVKRDIEIKKINEKVRDGQQPIDVERELYFKFL